MCEQNKKRDNKGRWTIVELMNLESEVHSSRFQLPSENTAIQNEFSIELKLKLNIH